MIARPFRVERAMSKNVSPPQPAPRSRAIVRGGALALALIALDAGAAQDLTITYYDVQGGNLQELRTSLTAHGPVGKDGARHHGHVDWHVGWNYDYAPRGVGCRIGKLRVDVKATMVLPRWTGLDTAPASLQQEWARYSQALRVHEDGHAAHADQAAEEIQRRFAAVGGGMRCTQFGEELNRIGQAVLDEYAARDKQYDDTTEHGATQGARL
jgi:predicted secreted Zn-dependent protease